MLQKKKEGKKKEKEEEPEQLGWQVGDTFATYLASFCTTDPGGRCHSGCS
jgi:hypothetical protein